MTGAPVPDGCEQVVPFELCHERQGAVTLADEALKVRASFIRRRGQDQAEGDLIARQGSPLGVEELLALAEDGRERILVHGRPRVAVLCTGSELVCPGERPRHGQKISGNGVLLRALVGRQGGDCIRTATVADDPDRIAESLAELLGMNPDLLVTTGGVGPGRFDLLDQVFTRMDGELHYNSLQVRPGKSTLHGTLAGIPFFGLPGPPPAVRLLFHELVAPALARLRGEEHPLVPLLEARLKEEVRGGRSPHLNLKPARAVFRDGRLTVQPVRRGRTMNAILHLQGGERVYSAGTTVLLRIVDGSSLF